MPSVPGLVRTRIPVFFARLEVWRGCVHREPEEGPVGPTTESYPSLMMTRLHLTDAPIKKKKREREKP